MRWAVLNTDGASKGNSSSAGGDGVVRGDTGNGSGALLETWDILPL